jgi:hypothetical protein
MDAEELLIHEGSEGKCTEGVHKGIVQAFGVLSLTCTRQRSGGSQRVRTCRLTLKPEIEVVGQESTFFDGLAKGRWCQDTRS